MSTVLPSEGGKTRDSVLGDAVLPTPETRTAVASCVVLGGGGHGRMVLEVLRCEGKYQPAGITDRQRKAAGLLGIPFLGDEGVLSQLPGRGIRYFVVGVGGVPDNRPRAALFEKARRAGLVAVSTVHPSAVASRDVTLGEGTVVMPRAVINPGAVLGANVIVNTASVIEHDTRLCDHVHVCPGAILLGGVEVGEGAFIGAGAVIHQGVHLGAWSVVGAGAIVLDDVGAGERVAGVPARPIAPGRAASYIDLVRSRNALPRPLKESTKTK